MLRETGTGDVYHTVLSVVFVSANSYLHSALHMASLSLAFYMEYDIVYRLSVEYDIVYRLPSTGSSNINELIDLARTDLHY